jgi:hypothetical protein
MTAFEKATPRTATVRRETQIHSMKRSRRIPASAGMPDGKSERRTRATPNNNRPTGHSRLEITVSEVRIYCVNDLYHSMQGNAYVVCADAYTAAQSHLAALREELAKCKAQLEHWHSLDMQREHRLTAAEQRNAVAYHLLMLWYSENALGRINVDDSAYHVVTATAEHFDSKPTESGASE